jgi:flagellar biosynthesis chaperone FliJ
VSAREQVRRAQTLQRVAGVHLRRSQVAVAAALAALERAHENTQAQAIRLAAAKEGAARGTAEVVERQARTLAAATALSDARRAVGQCEVDLLEARADLIAAHATSRSRDRLVERRLQALREHQQTIEQRLLDEAASNMRWSGAQ